MQAYELDLEGALSKLVALFESDDSKSQAVLLGEGIIHFELNNPRWGETIKLTFERMMRLPAIVGTEHIDFETPYSSDGHSEESGSFGGHNNLTIVCRYGALP